jgi:predicted alpha/beta hydrolase family esterase
MASTSSKTDVILFVHGLSGSADGTWSKMVELFLRDEIYSKIEVDTYEYPTSKFRLPFSKKMPGIPELAEGLASHIDAYHSGKTNVILVGHSLGGLVLRYYIVNAFKKPKANNIRAAAMIATPHTGSDLARLGGALSWRHTHLKQLVKGETILTSILTDWASLEIESRINTLYVTGGVDAIVPRDSSMPYYGGVNFQNLIQHGHVDIIKPEHSTDIRFLVLKKFIMELDSSKKAKADLLQEEGWPLFFRYQQKCERFYYVRQVDEVIEQALSGSNIWLSGPAGMGKTVALTRAILNKGWTVYYFSLDGFLELSATDLMKEICRQLMDRLGISDEVLNKSTSLAEILRCISAAFQSVVGEKKVAMFIEEIPIVCTEEYSRFLDLAYHLSMIQDTCQGNLEVVWVFSSIIDPIAFAQREHVKLQERYAFLKVGTWKPIELRELLTVIDKELQFEFTGQETEEILAASKNSPRYLKMLLKTRRTEVGSKKSVADLILSAPIGGN